MPWAKLCHPYGVMWAEQPTNGASLQHAAVSLGLPLERPRVARPLQKARHSKPLPPPRRASSWAPEVTPGHWCDSPVARLSRGAPKRCQVTALQRLGPRCARPQPPRPRVIRYLRDGSPFLRLAAPSAHAHAAAFEAPKPLCPLARLCQTHRPYHACTFMRGTIRSPTHAILTQRSRIVWVDVYAPTAVPRRGYTSLAQGQRSGKAASAALGTSPRSPALGFSSPRSTAL